MHATERKKKSDASLLKKVLNLWVLGVAVYQFSFQKLIYQGTEVNDTKQHGFQTF